MPWRRERVETLPAGWFRTGLLTWLLAVATPMIAPTVQAEPNLESGAKAYLICYNCHSLEPGVHLTGPSLAGIVGRRAGTVDGFGRYSEALRNAGFTWTDEALDAWFKDPQALVPGNTMILRGMAHDRVRANLIAFLKVALAPGGAEKVVALGLLSQDHARGRVPAVLSDTAPDRAVTGVRHCGDAYWVTTADGRETLYWERNLHFKTDTGERGPRPGRPVLVEIGSVGDRASVVFASPAELARALSEGCR